MHPFCSFGKLYRTGLAYTSFMKKMLFLFLIIVTGLFAHAQTEGKPGGNTIKAATPVSKKVEVAKEGIAMSFETNLVPGDLTLTKGYQKGDGEAFETFYTLIKRKDPTFNNRKPVRISLSRKSFDSVFTYVSTEMSAKRALLDKYMTEQKISPNNEQGWIALVRYYNNL
jgi:hypothetical protein